MRLILAIICVICLVWGTLGLAFGQTLRIERDGQRITLRWSESNFTAQVKSDLNSTNWLPLGNMSATPTGYYAETRMERQAFFRLIRKPTTQL